MKKFLAILMMFLVMPCCVFAVDKTVEDLESEMKIDIDTANVATLKAVVEAWDEELSVYHDLIDKCLLRLEKLGASSWVKAYRGRGSLDDLSSLSLDELAALRDKINIAMMASDEWQEVTVPKGVYIVGVDIPAGHWTIRTDAISCSIEITDKLDETGKNHDWSGDIWDSTLIHAKNDRFDPASDIAEVDYVFQDGWYVIIEYGAAVFTPYTGKPDLGFK